jgi:hypothetical protein
MPIDLRWWQAKNAHDSVQAWLQSVEPWDATRRGDDEHHLRLYSEREWSLYTSTDPRRTMRGTQRPRKRLKKSLNVVKNAIDAWVNLISRDRPHVNYLTKGADWSLQKKARLRTRFCEALFHQNKAYALANRVAKFAGITGMGAIHVVKAHGRIYYDPVMLGEVVVDPSEALSGDPRSLARVRPIDKEVAKERWPEHAKAIDRAQTIGSGQVLFVDIWHLRSGPNADDGWHMQVLPGVATLSKTEYQWEQYPIVSYRFDDAPVGWHGTGIAEELSGIQIEINSVLTMLSENTWNGGNLKVAIARGSNVVMSALTNELGCPIVEYTGNNPPTFFANDVASPQVFQYLSMLETKAYEITGISQMNAQSQNPFASMSGRARIVANQSYSQRFVVSQRRFEDWFAELADRSLEAASDLEEAGEDLEVIFPGRDHLEVIRYSDIAAEPFDFDCQAWTASLAGETPAARLAHIEQMMSLGMIDLAGAMYLYEIPHDLRAHMEAVLAPIELAREAIDRIIEDGAPSTPTPMMDLQLCAKQSQLWYQRGVLRGVDPQRLYLLLDFHKMSLDLLMKTQQQAPAPANDVNLQGATLQAPPVAMGM